MKRALDWFIQRGILNVLAVCGTVVAVSFTALVVSTVAALMRLGSGF